MDQNIKEQLIKLAQDQIDRFIESGEFWYIVMLSLNLTENQTNEAIEFIEEEIKKVKLVWPEEAIGGSPSLAVHLRPISEAPRGKEILVYTKKACIKCIVAKLYKVAPSVGDFFICVRYGQDVRDWSSDTDCGFIRFREDELAGWTELPIIKGAN